jgi:hypothetical protein
MEFVPRFGACSHEMDDTSVKALKIQRVVEMLNG